LHYLSKSTVVNILNEVVLKSNSIACHWFSIFTDIYRRGTDGQMIMVENEAQFNSNEFIALIGQVYSNWHISISTQYYEEGEYFQAYKVSVIAQKNT
jgi:hypothetical protein